MKGTKTNIALVCCGGSGERYGSPIPKQFLPFEGKPLCLYAIETLQQSKLIDRILVVTKIGTMADMRKLLDESGIDKATRIVEGGSTRQESVRIGLEALKSQGAEDDDIVLIQDGDRPNLSLRLIQEGIRKAEDCGASVTAIPSSDSIFLAKDGEKAGDYLDRKTVYAVQTPQTFRFKSIYEAHQTPKEGYTDDASMVKAMGNEVAIVIGDKQNYKINTPEDGDRFVDDLRRNKR